MTAVPETVAPLGRSGDRNRRRGGVGGCGAAELDELGEGRDAAPVQDEEQVVAGRRNTGVGEGP